MTVIGWFQIILFLGVILALTKPFGTFMYKVFEGQKTWLTPIFRPLEKVVYKIGGVKEDEEMPWTTYTLAMLLFSVITLVVTYAALRWQAYLPLNPMHFGDAKNAPSYGTAMTPDLAFNTAISFTTNTNWQNYGGENTMSYFSQMVALASHNFFSAATGIAIAIALVRGLGRRSAQSIGNFWVDLTRATVYVLLPLCLVYALVLCQQGVIQNFHAYHTATTLEGTSQIIPGGPFASQEAIKMLGTNGGGPFNVNSGAPVREPDGADRLSASPFDLFDRRGYRLHVRPVCRQCQARLGALGRDGFSIYHRRLCGLCPGSQRQPADRCGRCRRPRECAG